MKISLIITVYNRLNLLEKCLELLLLQNLLPDEIILSDDGSEDDPLPILEKLRADFKGRVHYVRQEHQEFRAARVRNNGVSLSTGDILVFLDQDILMPADYLKVIAKTLKPGRFLSGYPVRLSEAQTEELLKQNLKNVPFREVVNPKQHRKIIRQWMKDYLYYSLEKISWPYSKGVKLRSGVSAMLRKDFVKVNGFDESFVGWGNEDDDLGKRMRAGGCKGFNFVLTQFPLHLYHEPYHGPKERRNKTYAAKRRSVISKDSYRCEKGLDSPRPDIHTDLGV